MAFYQRHLPHWQPEGAEFFITFRLAGSLPKKAIHRLKAHREQLEKKNEIENKDKIQKQIFEKYEDFLNEVETGPTWLKEESIANVVENTLHFYDEKAYDLYAYCVMPNHAHVVFRHMTKKRENDDSKNDYPITKILHSIKSYSASECNKILNRTAAFWQSESYDRVIRDQDELENIIRYTLNNPVKAGLVEQWEEWAHSYCKPGFIDTYTTT